MSDRIFGGVILVGALLYGLGALRLEAAFLGGPVGPKVFPLILAITFAVLGLALLLAPSGEPTWPEGRGWLELGLVGLSFVLYGALLVPLGFLLATTLETGFVSWRFGARPLTALVVGAAVAAALWLLFVLALGIPLPLGRWLFGGR